MGFATLNPYCTDLVIVGMADAGAHKRRPYIVTMLVGATLMVALFFPATDFTGCRDGQF